MIAPAVRLDRVRTRMRVASGPDRYTLEVRHDGIHVRRRYARTVVILPFAQILQLADPQAPLPLEPHKSS